VAGRERIFLYGTLRRGGSRDATRFYAGAEFVAPARVRGVLHDFGEYPGLRLDAEAGWVRGEIFEVTPEALAGLDAWEGIDPAAPNAGEYRRVRVCVDREDGASEECWIYEARASVCAGRPVIVGGDWIVRRAGASER
jgi:gamma-glutamylcyclotransferase (GGCT)/AIG2-like uncharacterized protein YtfP